MSTTPTKYLLDTNAISEYRKISKGKADINFTEWQRPIHISQLYLSSITIMELNIGILQLARRDESQATMLSHWLNHKVLPAFECRIYGFDVQSALICSELHVPDPRSDRDAMIASVAINNDLYLVTRNVKDFILMDLGDRLINPFS